MAIFKGRARGLLRNKIAQIQSNGGNFGSGRLAGMLQSLGGPGVFDPETGALQIQHQIQQPKIPWTPIAIGAGALVLVLIATRK